jgi:hypothetical protein
MSARFCTDSKGTQHYILHQEMTQSCGPACVAMAEGLYKLSCMLDPELRARQLSQKYPGSFQQSSGTNATNLSHILNAESVPCYGAFNASGRLFDYFNYYLGERTPIIAHIAWSGGGGHFTLLRKIYPDGTLIFLDPWYDVVEVSRSRLPNYVVSDGSGTLSGWINIVHT